MLSTSLAVVGCQPAETTTPRVVAPENVSFSRDVSPLLAVGCAARACHGDPDDSDLPLLLPEQAHSALTENVDGGPLVVPGAPGASILWHKLSGNPVAGARMPPAGAPLGPEALKIIRAWILEGARNN